jgi:hypothetical protein
VPISYLPGKATRIRVRAAGDLDMTESDTQRARD